MSGTFIPDGGQVAALAPDRQWVLSLAFAGSACSHC